MANGLTRQCAFKKIRVNIMSAGTVYFMGCVWNSVEQIMPKQYEGVLARNPPAAWPRRANATVFLASPLSICLPARWAFCKPHGTFG